MMNHPHHHHPHPHHHHHHHHPHPHGVAIGPMPNPCIGMMAAPTAAGPVLAGIGVPIMTAAAPTLVPPPPPPIPQPPHNQQQQQQHGSNNNNKKLVMSPDSSDDKDKCPVHPFIQARTSSTGGTVVVSCSGGPGAGSQLTWSSPSPAGPIMPAGIAYPVMGIPPGALGGEPNPAAATGMIYGVPIPDHQVNAGVNSVISLPTSSPAVVTAVQPPQPQPTAISISPVIPTQNNPGAGVVGSTTISPLGGGAGGAVVQQQQQLTPPTSSPNSLQQQQQPAKEIIHCKSCTLFPPNPNAPPPTTREKPPGCRTAFVGGLPENIREDIVREIFERCGEITTIRMSKKNFCHIRFEMEQFVELALYLSGYRIRIGSNSDSANIGRLHVDYAQARDDLYEWECRQRQLLREQRHRERLEHERLQPASPPPAVHYSDHEAANVAERIKGDDTFMKAIQTLFSWLEKGECIKRNSNTFYSMIQSINSQIRRLLSEKALYEDDFQKAKDLLRQRMTGLLLQFSQIDKVFSAASQRKVWDHFSKAQRKNIEGWKKQASEIKNVLLEEALNERADEEMEFSDLESDSSGQSNKENGEPPRAKKMRLSGEDAKTVHQLKEENDALRCQLEASKNEVDLIKADLRTELEMKDQQLRSLQQQVMAVQRNASSSPNSVMTCPSSGSSGSNSGDDSSATTTPSGNHHTSSSAGGSTIKQNLHSPPVSVSSSSSPRFGMSPTHNNSSSITGDSSGTKNTATNDDIENARKMGNASIIISNNDSFSAGNSNGTSSCSDGSSSDKNAGGGGNNSNREFQGFCDSSSNSSSSSSIGSLLHPHNQQQSAQNNQHNQNASNNTGSMMSQQNDDTANNNGHNNGAGGGSGGTSSNSGFIADDNGTCNPHHHNKVEIFIGAGENGNGVNNTSSNSIVRGITSIENFSSSHDQQNGVIIGICDKEARLLGIISTFLHVHPFGASLDYIWSYAQKVLPAVRPNQIEVLMTKFPSLFKQEMSGIGATFERKWVFVGFT